MTCIELVGCTSAGKTTLANRILQFCRDRGINARLGEDFLLEKFGLIWISSAKTRAILVNLISLPVALIKWGNYHSFIKYSYRVVSQLEIILREKIYIIRNVLKIIGIFEIANKVGDEKIIILDEGPLNCINALFVHVKVHPEKAKISEYVRLVPFPDVAIYLREQEEVLLTRTQARGHNRIRKGDIREMQQFIHSSIYIFESLLEEPAVQSRFVILDNNRVIQPQQQKFNDPLLGCILSIINGCLNGSSVDINPDRLTGCDKISPSPIRDSLKYEDES